MQVRAAIVHLATASCGLALFHLVSLFSGRIGVFDGLGWDGGGYARMVTDGLTAGSGIMQTRPLLILLTRVPVAFGLDIIPAFELLNRVYIFILSLFVSLLLAKYGARPLIRGTIVCNLALCIATSKMYAFYPVLIDLGALAVITGAFYLAAADRPKWAGAASILAVASREFGIAVCLYGIHRALRQRRYSDAFWYVPAIAVMFVIRQLAASFAAVREPLGLADALDNLTFWTSPPFVVIFAYFTLTVFGGVSAVLVTKPRWLAGRLRAEPEVATFAVVILGLTALGDIDIWRYLVFILPAAVVLIAQYWHTAPPASVPAILAGMTAMTVVTQRPFEQMVEPLYFRDWFPLYQILSPPMTPEIVAVWTVRISAAVLLTLALWLMQRPLTPATDPA